MTVDFSDYPQLQGFFHPVRYDAEVYDCEVEGTIPAGIDGTFYRAGYDWVYPPKFPDDSPFAADGYASMFRIRDGNCDFRGKFVRTPRYIANAKARKQLFGYYRNPWTSDPSVRDLDHTVANTNIVFHGGRLFALKEDALPYEVHPDTLETIGPYDFDGKYKSPAFTAHPKIDPHTGEMITYGYEAEGPASNAIWMYTVDRAGNVTSERRFSAPAISMVHDIAVSQNFILIPINGFVTSMERLKDGKIHWGYDTTRDCWIGVLPRDGDASDVRWFRGPPQSCITHTFSAYDKDGVITMHAPTSDSNVFPFFPNIDDVPFDRKGAYTAPRKFVMDMNSKKDTWQEERVFQKQSGALSRIDDRFQADNYRYGLMGYRDQERPFDEQRAGRMRGRVTNCYGRMDFHTGKLESFFAGDTHALQEVCFVPRSPDAPEADGYFLGVCSDFAEQRSELVIADTSDLAAGAVARVKLPFRLSTQIHGNWVPGPEVRRHKHV